NRDEVKRKRDHLRHRASDHVSVSPRRDSEGGREGRKVREGPVGQVGPVGRAGSVGRVVPSLQPQPRYFCTADSQLTTTVSGIAVDDCATTLTRKRRPSFDTPYWRPAVVANPVVL